MLGGWVSYWMIPLFSAVVWLAMLLSLLLHWVTQGKPIYPSMQSGQTIAYISDAGAYEFKPLFISMGAVSVVTFDLVFIAEQYLRFKGRLLKNNTRAQNILAWFSIIFAIIGAAGLILLSVFDTYRHNVLHNIFLALFIGGYVISAVFTCAEYQRLGALNREPQNRILRVSFWVKLAFILIEVALAIAFGVLNRLKRWNNAAIVEWVIALVYTFYVASYALDFRPATRTARAKLGHGMPDDKVAMAESLQNNGGLARDEEAGGRYGTAPFYPSGTTAASGPASTNGFHNNTHNTETRRSFL